MNTADRSLAIVDYALRRRFSFIDIEPAYNKQSFSDYLEKNVLSKELIERINLKLGNLNQIIEKDNRLGKGFRIGHSYFSGNVESENETEWYKSIIQTEITPLILEYWFDDEPQAVGHIEKLLEI
jgi:5-methylcytosine-specific restriction enzyme B